MRDSWQGQTSRPSSGAAYTSLRSSPPRFRCRLLPVLFRSFLSSLLLSWQKISVYAHTENDGIRGRGRLRRLKGWGLYTQVGRQERYAATGSPLLHLRRLRRVQVPRTGPGRIACCSRGRTHPRIGGSVRVPALHTNCAITCNGARKKWADRSCRMMMLGNWPRYTARKIAGTKSLTLCYILQISSESPVRIRYDGRTQESLRIFPLYRVSRDSTHGCSEARSDLEYLSARTIVSAINPILCPSLQITDRVLIDFSRSQITRVFLTHLSACAEFKGNQLVESCFFKSIMRDTRQRRRQHFNVRGASP